MTPFGLSLMRPDGFAPWHDEWASSFDGDCPPQPAKCRRWAPLSCPTEVIAHPAPICSDGSPVRKRLGSAHLVSPLCSVKRRRWSQFAIVPHKLPRSDLSVVHGNLD